MTPQPLTTIYKEINSSKISVDIYLPPRNASNNHTYPVLINIHGGAFMLGHSRMVSMAQIDDCLARGWIVVVPNHRLCPGADLLNGPMADLRDFIAWIYSGNLEGFLQEEVKKEYRVDTDRVMAFGTSSGGFLALALGFDTPHPPAAILNFYGAVHFAHPFWRKPLPHVQANLPRAGFEPAFLQKVYDEYPIPTTSGISLEGQAQQSNKPDFSRPRDAFALTQIANGTVLDAIFPAGAGRLEDIDPVSRVTSSFPPTFIVHGDSDRMVPVELSRKLFEVLKGNKVECEMVEVEGEDHTFALGMEIGGKTWNTSRKGFEWLEGIIQ
ncbi:Alpha/Beta hydrolase protein [Aspergillus pseudoustus]|uniref:Alpha/Beta hydrolase protein n=1 Tax=Aspergillus pseudoustus TaxID=1810923 RepID=A0ABR4IU70_9EURO